MYDYDYYIVHSNGNNRNNELLAKSVKRNI